MRVSGNKTQNRYIGRTGFYFRAFNNVTFFLVFSLGILVLLAVLLGWLGAIVPLAMTTLWWARLGRSGRCLGLLSFEGANLRLKRLDLFRHLLHRLWTFGWWWWCSGILGRRGRSLPGELDFHVMTGSDVAFIALAAPWVATFFVSLAELELAAAKTSAHFIALGSPSLGREVGSFRAVVRLVVRGFRATDNTTGDFDILLGSG